MKKSTDLHRLPWADDDKMRGANEPYAFKMNITAILANQIMPLNNRVKETMDSVQRFCHSVKLSRKK